jgi:hypothetical protein
MFKITIEGDTLEALASNIVRIAGQFQTTSAEPMDANANPAPKATSRKKAAATPKSEQEPDAPDPELDAELNEPVDPAPAGATAVVDAGTGKPMAPADAGDVVQMTFDDVKKSAAKLASKDMPGLATILQKYGAANLSGVPKDKLGDFAADVVEALALA